MSMRGIDISTYQRGLDLGNIDFDFAIIKATEGTKLVQDTCDPWVQQCIRLGKRWGFYHFFAGGDPIKEAEFFVANTKNYFGKGIAVIDYEAYGMTGAANVKKFVERVHELTGVWCVLYMSRSVIKADDWSAIAPTCPLWVAQYANDEIVNGHQSNPWIQAGGFGPWASPAIHQYTSHGRLAGWSGNLDLDKAYITAEEWDALAAGDKAQDKPTTPSPAPAKGIVKGSVVRVKSGAKDYNGGGLAGFVYTRDHVVSEVSGDRCVITYNGVVVAAVRKSDLTLVSGGGSSSDKPTTPSSAPTQGIVKGSVVRVKSGAKDYNGGGLAGFVYTRDHVVSEVSGDRCVITYNGVVVAAVRKSDLTLVSGGGSSSNAKPTAPAPSKEIVKGSVVRVKQGAKDYNGGGLASFVYTRNHVVSEVSGNRCVITYNGVVVAAVHKSDLTLV